MILKIEKNLFTWQWHSKIVLSYKRGLGSILTCGAARRHWHRITSSPTHPLKLFFINSFTCIRPTWQRLDAKLTHSPHIPTQPLKSFTILFLIFNFYSQLKQVFCSKYPSNKRFGANLKKLLLNFAANFLLFSFLSLKTLKINILTCDWRAQHPNAGRNIQQEMLTGAPVKGCLLSNSRLSEVEACMVPLPETYISSTRELNLTKRGSLTFFGF